MHPTPDDTPSPFGDARASAGGSRSGSSAASRRTPDLERVFDEFEAYPFSDDPDFKAGLPVVISAIRGQPRSVSQIDEMIARAQWFFFCRLKGLSIPFETYASPQARRSNPHSSPSSSHAPSPGTAVASAPGSGASPQAPSMPQGSSSPGLLGGGRRPPDPLAQLNTLAEAKRMMEAAAGDKQGEEGMSFAMLTRLISEGRASEVGEVRQIPDEINDAEPSRSAMQPRPKPWQTPQPAAIPSYSSLPYGQGQAGPFPPPLHSASFPPFSPSQPLVPSQSLPPFAYPPTDPTSTFPPTYPTNAYPPPIPTAAYPYAPGPSHATSPTSSSSHSLPLSLPSRSNSTALFDPLASLTLGASYAPSPGVSATSSPNAFAMPLASAAYPLQDRNQEREQEASERAQDAPFEVPLFMPTTAAEGDWSEAGPSGWTGAGAEAPGPDLPT